MTFTIDRNLESLSPHQDIMRELARAFQPQDLFLVGGSVRDALLGKDAKDLDFTTPMHPQDVYSALESVADKVWDTGIEYGTVSASVHGEIVEITTFRADTYDGDSRNPDVQFGQNIDDDLTRRDFTINAMALRINPEETSSSQTNAEGLYEFIDPMGGLADLEARVIDTPATPQQSFHDDPLRMLRACRFVSQLDFEPSERVVDAMTDMAGEIQRISVERVAQELNKLMLGSAPWKGIDLMVRTGLADYILPEIPALKLTQDEGQHHKDVYQHSLKVLSNAVRIEQERGHEPDLVARWAALLHDIGKPDTRSFGPNGAVSFYNHDTVGARLTRRRMRKLKQSNQLTQDVGQLVFLHMRFYGYSNGEWTDSAVRRYVNDAGDLLEQLHIVTRADTTTQNKRKANWLKGNYDQLEQRIADLTAQEDLEKVRPELDGNEIMQILDLSPGPDVGRAWAFMKELRLDNGPMEHNQAVDALKQWWAQQQSTQ